jgi:hypothetical protein
MESRYCDSGWCGVSKLNGLPVVLPSFQFHRRLIFAEVRGVYAMRVITVIALDKNNESIVVRIFAVDLNANDLRVVNLVSDHDEALNLIR